MNKSSSRVHLIHKPSGIQVFCQDARDLSTNRVRARKYLIDKLDAHYNEDESKYAKAQEKIRKRKSSSKRKAKKKYEGGKEGKEEEDEDEDGEDDLSFEEQLLLESEGYYSVYYYIVYYYSTLTHHTHGHYHTIVYPP